MSTYIPDLRDFAFLLFKPLLFHRIVYFTVTFTEFNHVVIPGIFGSAIATRWLTGYRSGRNLAHFRRRLQVLLRERNPVLPQGYLRILHGTGRYNIYCLTDLTRHCLSAYPK